MGCRTVVEVGEEAVSAGERAVPARTGPGRRLPLAPRPLVDLLALPGLALLPARLRDELGIAWDPRRAATARALDVAIHAWVRAMPPVVRSMPQATAAFRRAAAADVL